MTLLEDGSYIILSNKNLSYALDVYGSNDYNGANIMLYNKHGDIGGAQIVNVVTHENGYQSIRIPVTGKCFCISGGQLFNENLVHQWVWHDGHVSAQYPDGDHRCLWTVEQINGLSATVNGTSYPVYAIRSAKNRQYAIHIYWAQAKPNQKICIFQTEDPVPSGATQAQWVFIPVNALKKAAYRLTSRVNSDVCIGITEGANGAGSNVYLVGNQDSNSQRWIAIEDSGYSLMNAENGMLMRAVEAKNQANVELSDKSDSYSKWSFNFVESDMEQLTNFSIELQAGQNFVLDAKNGISAGTKIGTNLQVYTNWGGQNQRWTAIMESLYDKTLPAISGLQYASSSGGNAVDVFAVSQAASIYPFFIGSDGSYQIRYRIRSKKLGSSEFGDWGSWKSLADDSTEFNGWGSEFSPNAVVTKINGRLYSTKAIRMAPTSTDYYLYEIETSARMWTPKTQSAYLSDYPGHGPAASATCKIGYRPTLTISSVKFHPKGIAIAFSSDLKIEGNTLVIDSALIGMDPLCKPGAESDAVSYTGTAYIPFEFIPAAGSTVSLKAHLKTSDGIESSVITYSGSITYDASGTATVSPTITISEIGLANISLTGVGESDSVIAYVQYNSEAKFEKYEFASGSGSASVPIRYDSPYTIWLTYDTGSVWGIYHQAYSALTNPHLYMFVFNDEDGNQCAFAIKVNVRDHPRMTTSYSPEYDSYTTMGDQYENVSYSGAIPQTFALDGVLLPILSSVYSTSELAIKALEAGYAYFRAPKMPYIARVAITNMQLDDSQPDWTKISLNAKRIG